MCRESVQNRHVCLQYRRPSSLSSFPLRSLIFHVVRSILLAAEGPSYPPSLIKIPSDPLVYQSLLSAGLHGLVMIFPLRVCSSQILSLPFVVGSTLAERSSFSITCSKQTNDYCPNDHLHRNSNTSLRALRAFKMSPAI